MAAHAINVEQIDRPKPVSPKKDHEAILKEARRCFQQANDADAEIRRQARQDSEFRAGKQWNEKAAQIREAENRPILTINLIEKFIKQVSNEQRQQRPALQVSPIGSVGPATASLRLQTDPRDAADIWQGLIRHIELRSDAECAYDTMFDQAVGDSFGWCEVTAEYAGDDTMDQELAIKRILDQFAVYVDPNAKEPDRSDMQWAFVVTRMARDEFERLYPNTEAVQRRFWADIEGGPGPLWLDEDGIQVAKYWRIAYKKRKLQYLTATADPDTLSRINKAFRTLRIEHSYGKDDRLTFKVYRDEYDELPIGVEVATDEDGNSLERELDWPTVEWYLLTGSDVLDEGEWRGRWIPLIPCLGEEKVVNGKRMLISLTRFLRDPQVLYNFFRSQQAEIIALTPKAPFVGAVGQFKTHSAQWALANQKTYPYLEYDPIPVGNSLAPPPQRNIAEPPIQAVTAAATQAGQEFREISSIYNPALGAPSNETSGRAIFARQQESNNANFHFLDNFKRSMRHVGRVLLDLIPYYYDRQNRIIRIVKPDDTQEMVMINGETEYKGKKVFFDPDVGRYDISVQVGPSYQSALDQTFSMLSQFIQSAPPLLNVLGDLMFRAAPLPGHIGLEAADRMKVMLDPKIQAMSASGKAIDPAVQAQLAQLQQTVQQQQGIIGNLSTVIKTKILELESKERMNTESNMTKLLAAEVSSKSADAQRLAQMDHDSVKHRLELSADADQAEKDRLHQREIAAMQPAQGNAA